MSRRLHDALDVCLAALESGASMEACLALFPDLSDELSPPLEAAAAARLLGEDEPQAGAAARSRAILLAQSANRPTFLDTVLAMPRTALAGLGLAAIFVLAGAGLYAGSARSLPGQTLYPVKLSIEELSLQLAPGEDARQNLMEAYSKRRVDELRLLRDLERSVPVSFTGFVSIMETGRWIVGEVEVVVGAEVVIDPDIAVGSKIEVHGTTRGKNQVSAERLVLLEYLFSGTVTQINQDHWMIAGKRVEILATTAITPGIRQGMLVLADVIVEGDLALARAIFALEPLVPPTASAFPTRTKTPPPTEVDPSETPETDEPDEEHSEEHDDEEGEEVRFEGVVQSISSSVWVIGGQQVKVDSETEIEKNPRVGDTVQVRAIQQADGSLLAEEIEKVD